MLRNFAMLALLALLCASLERVSASWDGSSAAQAAVQAEADKADPRVQDRYIVMAKKGVDLDEFRLHIAVVREVTALANLNLHKAAVKVKREAAKAAALGQLYARAKRPSDSPTQKIFSRQQAVTHIYDSPGFVGYAGIFSPTTMDQIRKNSDIVDYIERDSIRRISSEQHNAPWGLSRISHGKSRGDEDEKQTYHYPDTAGNGVVAYIVDTGVYIMHKDFNGRASWGKTFSSSEPYDKDGHGHGTHVAATVAGLTYGVAKAASIVAVKVLGSDGSGTDSDVISGILWTIEDHQRRVKSAEGTKNRTLSVANMSLGGGISTALDNAINHAVQAGVHYAVAAGNDFANACLSSPSRADLAITVGATDSKDRLAEFSNHGKCVNIQAPGVAILSAGIAGPDSTATMSGTSMASPHVCGLLALTLSEHPAIDFDHDTLLAHIMEAATRGAIKGMPKKGHHDGGNNNDDNDDGNVDSSEGKTPNRLAFVFDTHNPEPSAVASTAGSADTAYTLPPDAFERGILGESNSGSIFSLFRGIVPIF